MALTVGSDLVIESGTAICGTGEGFELKHKDLTFTFDFKDDDGTESKVTGDGQGKALKLHLHNFGKSIGGTTYVSEVGTSGGKKLYLRLFVQSVQDTKLVAYNLSLRAQA